MRVLEGVSVTKYFGGRKAVEMAVRNARVEVRTSQLLKRLRDIRRELETGKK